MKTLTILVYKLSEKKYIGKLKSFFITDKLLSNKEVQEYYEKENNI